ncbi:hypothetical protein BJ912DRAFT_960675 [Pholiota molesta]|nr:hypothetical protein BJ912DRAFT_960675 [Pholiota molesta]
MTTSMLQDTVQTASSGSGPRFRPYASPNHHVTKGRYITSNDVRGYIPVYEYPLNGQWIMMDIDDGYILWTGIWKALGNSKADIVKMIDSQPDLAPLIRTWMPYEVALKLSRRVAWAIRDDLIPLFGPTFPSTCLAPDQPGYGQVVPTGQGRRRARRSTQTAIMQMPRAPAGWTVVTPNNGSPVAHSGAMRESAPLHPPYILPHPDYEWNPRAAVERHHYSPVESHVDARPSLRPSYSSYPPTSFRKLAAGPATKTGLSLDIRSLSMREGSSKPTRGTRLFLPPISAMESLRDGGSSDSAAVLRRLRMDDDYPKPAAKSSDEQAWTRRHSLSTSKPMDTSPRFQPYSSPRSHQEHSTYRPRSSSSVSHGYHQPVPKRTMPPFGQKPRMRATRPRTPPPPRRDAEFAVGERGPRPVALCGTLARGKHFPGIAGR